jgi:hypothetical protein
MSAKSTQPLNFREPIANTLSLCAELSGVGRQVDDLYRGRGATPVATPRKELFYISSEANGRGCEGEWLNV